MKKSIIFVLVLLLSLQISCKKEVVAQVAAPVPEATDTAYEYSYYKIPAFAELGPHDRASYDETTEHLWSSDGPITEKSFSHYKAYINEEDFKYALYRFTYWLKNILYEHNAQSIDVMVAIIPFYDFIEDYSDESSYKNITVKFEEDEGDFGDRIVASLTIEDYSNTSPLGIRDGHFGGSKIQILVASADYDLPGEYSIYDYAGNGYDGLASFWDNNFKPLVDSIIRFTGLSVGDPID